MNPSPRFTGLFIPVEILNNQELTMLEQMLLSWIDALFSTEHKGCYASNEYFSKKLKVKENTIAKALTSLRQKGLIEDVSFDGRHRIIRAKIGSYVDKCQSNPALDLNPTPIGSKSNPALDENPNPSYIRDKRLKQSLNTPTKAPHSKEKEAKASKCEFSLKVQKVIEAMTTSLFKHCPVYRLPEDMTRFYQSVHAMIEEDRQDPDIVIDHFDWAVSDTEQNGDWKGWQGIIARNKKSRKKADSCNPAEFFRDHLTSIYAKKRSKPKRLFAASSNDEKAVEEMDEWARNGL